MKQNDPNLIVIAGPNGAGKSTIAPSLLKTHLEVREFVNADLIAEGLSGFQPEGAAIHAGRAMLKRIIEQLLKTGYAFHLIFLWLPDEVFAIARVAERVRFGGHHIPEETIRRRYHAGLRNFFSLYRRLADRWFFYDNSSSSTQLIAHGSQEDDCLVKDAVVWHNIKETYGSEDTTEQ